MSKHRLTPILSTYERLSVAFHRFWRQDPFFISLLFSVLMLILFSSSLQAAQNEAVAQISLTEASFLSPDYNLTDKKEFQFIGAGYDTVSGTLANHELEDGLQAQILGMVAPGTDVLSYLNVKQLFWKEGLLSIGRKKESWSAIDDNFDLGIYQPLFQWDPLMPQQQGLTGVFLTLEATDSVVPWGFVVFGSPLFIPDQGAGYQIRDGKFERSNPYFQTPPNFFQIRGQTDTADYHIQKPDTNDVIFNRSFAGKFYLGQESKGAFAQVAFANKPVNQLALGFQGFVTPNNSVDIEIQPQVYYHSLASADTQYSFEHWVVGMSALRETISSPDFDPQWTHVEYSRSDLLSPFVKTRWKDLNVTLAYLSVQGAGESVKGDLSEQSTSYLPHRYPFRSAYQAVVNYRLRLAGSRFVSLSTRYLQGAVNEFAQWTSQAAYQFRSNWSLNMVTQFVDVKDTPEGSMIASQAYNNNDAVAVGVSYVF